MRRYKTSYKSRRGVKRFAIGFSSPSSPPEAKSVRCTYCGGDVEEVPMMTGVCYTCYRELDKNFKEAKG